MLGAVSPSMPHEVLDRLVPLIGRWEGSGDGHYPTIQAFRYRETAFYGLVPGKPFISYEQRTWDEVTGEPLHSERGFLRLTEDGTVEAVLSHAFGMAEVSTGIVSESGLELRSSALGFAPSAKPVKELHRLLDWSRPDQLRYTLSMAFQEIPLSEHLAARLERIEEG